MAAAGRRGSRRRAAGALVTLPLATGLLLVAPASAELYRWSGADGVVRFTNDVESIPAAYRSSARVIESPRARPDEPRAADPVPRGAVIAFSPGGPLRATAELDGVPVTLLVDTGADRTVIAPAVVARAGLESGSTASVRILGVTGSADAREAVVRALDVAGARVGPLRVVVHELTFHRASSEPAADAAPGRPEDAVDGILGRDVLAYFTLTIDAGSGRALLVPR